jgi:hypothetical protein
MPMLKEYLTGKNHEKQDIDMIWHKIDITCHIMA